MPAVHSIFNNLLGCPPSSDIAFDRIHRALRPKGLPDAPLHDIVCCLTSYPLKEKILLKAGGNDSTLFTDVEMKLFQDLSPITLRQRRELQTLLQGITYKWHSVTFQVHTFNLHLPNDLQTFCENLQLEPLELPEWLKEFLKVDPELTPSRFLRESLVKPPEKWGERSTFSASHSPFSLHSPRLLVNEACLIYDCLCSFC